MKVEHFVKATAGGVGAQALNASDRIFTPDQVGGEDISTGTTRRFTKAFGGQKRINALTKAMQGRR